MTPHVRGLYVPHSMRAWWRSCSNYLCLPADKDLFIYYVMIVQTLENVPCLGQQDDVGFYKHLNSKE